MILQEKVKKQLSIWVDVLGRGKAVVQSQLGGWLSEFKGIYHVIGKLYKLYEMFFQNNLDVKE